MAILANQWWAVLATAVASSRSLSCIHLVSRQIAVRVRVQRAISKACADDKHLECCGEKRWRFASFR